MLEVTVYGHEIICLCFHDALKDTGSESPLLGVPCYQFGLGVVEFLDQLLGAVRGIVVQEGYVEIMILLPDAFRHIGDVLFLIVSRDDNRTCSDHRYQ
jgi:hypothetical protein